MHHVTFYLKSYFHLCLNRICDQTCCVSFHLICCPNYLALRSQMVSHHCPNHTNANPVYHIVISEYVDTACLKNLIANIQFLYLYSSFQNKKSFFKNSECTLNILSYWFQPLRISYFIICGWTLQRRLCTWPF